MNKTINLVFALLISTLGFAQHEGHQMAEAKIDPALTAYYKVKNALVDSDAKTAATEAKRLATLLKKSEKTIGSDAYRAANAMSASTDIAAQRAQLGSLTEGVYRAVKKAKPENTVYYAYCPMANNNKGGYWLSEKKEIANPYYGSKMLKCGSVKETL
ncbi:DUF3347 domain-containing protein [Persicitalea jodogahamensis]|uniref:DUF3347 domain-containing protein n=1 Tax=Persicitalea jodogahamensis TaxID=402147 RepID=A0A8J3DFU1_9BACT|nr:DUF3347 domain-containing protein [Persicitalea jodogahamensis]GHB87552.1 hypothetical protein GCM10007390_49340 [Persicitalea jodogahamensis]